jgi:hypothetical protein
MHSGHFKTGLVEFRLDAARKGSIQPVSMGTLFSCAGHFLFVQFSFDHLIQRPRCNTGSGGTPIGKIFLQGFLGLDQSLAVRTSCFHFFHIGLGCFSKIDDGAFIHHHDFRFFLEAADGFGVEIVEPAVAPELGLFGGSIEDPFQIITQRVV